MYEYCSFINMACPDLLTFMSCKAVMLMMIQILYDYQDKSVMMESVSNRIQKLISQSVLLSLSLSLSLSDSSHSLSYRLEKNSSHQSRKYRMYSCQNKCNIYILRRSRFIVDNVFWFIYRAGKFLRYFVAYELLHKLLKSLHNYCILKLLHFRYT